MMWKAGCRSRTPTRRAEGGGGERLTPKGFNGRMKAAQDAATGRMGSTIAAHGDGDDSGGFFSSVSIRVKLLGSLSLLTLIIIVLGAVSFVSLSEMNTISNQVTTEQAALARITEEIKATIFRARGVEKEFLLNEEQSALDNSTRFITKMRGQIEKASEIGGRISESSGQDVSTQYVSLAETVDQYQQQFSDQVKNVQDARKAIDANISSTTRSQEEVVSQATAIGGRIRTLVDDYWVTARKLSQKATKDAQTVFDANSTRIADAKDLADGILSDAAGKSAGVVKDARIKAEGLVKDVRVKAEGLVKDASATASNKVDDAKVKAESLVSGATSKASELVRNAQDTATNLLREESSSADVLLRSAGANDASNSTAIAAAKATNLVSNAANKAGTLAANAASEAAKLAADASAQASLLAADAAEEARVLAADASAQASLLAADASSEAAKVTAVAAEAAVQAAIDTSRAESLRITTALKEGVLLVDLGRFMLDVEVQMARFLQINQSTFDKSITFGEAALVALKEAGATAEAIRQQSSDLTLNTKMRDAVRDIESLSKTFSAVIAATRQARTDRRIADQEIERQKQALLNTGEDLLALSTQLSNNSWNGVGTLSAVLRKTGGDAQTQLLIVALAGIFIGIFVVIIIPRPITAGLAQLLGVAQRVAGGDLTQQVKVNSRDELGQLAGTFEQMRINLLALVHRIQVASTQITTTVNEIQAAANQQSSSANEQSSSITQFSGTMGQLAQTAEGLSDTALTMADNAGFVANKMGDNSSSSKKTLTSMQAIIEATRQTSERIKSLNDQMDGISTAVDSISSIADQTTLLSLNAAIEANKAGEMGEGFAVVATEIRRLSDRSTDSAAMIRTMVRDIQRATESSVISMDKSSEEIRIGIELVEESSQSLDSLNDQVRTITQQTQDISASSTEQSQVSREAKSTTEQMLSSATLSAEAARQTSAAAYELTSMSAQLSDAVASFKLS